MADGQQKAKQQKDFFPLSTVGHARDYFQHCLKQDDPDLTLSSIVIGHLEHLWTTAKVPPPTVPVSSSFGSSEDESSSATSNCLLSIEPSLDWSSVEALYARFEGIIKGYCDPNLLREALQADASASSHRKLIKHVADIVWNTLSKSHYKDRPHLQSIFSYLTGNKLDCFGVAYAVVAACQLLGVPHIHLALSEDHAWVVFGADGTETAEVTWHGKGNEDKRGQPVEITKAKNSWLYAAGQPVVCTRHMEVAAAVSSINPAISANVDSIECGALQQELLWLLYDMGHLTQYPMALGNLGDLEEISPSVGRPHCTKLFSEAIEVDQRVFSNHHVYPYTYQGGYFYRNKEYKNALRSWSDAADAIRRYKYSKDDEEIYKEFLEIANELIPHLVKTAAHNPKTHREVLRDPECFSFILRFYDGICCWEEDSTTPVLHIGWAKPMVSTCSKFEHEIRSKVQLPRIEDDRDSGTVLSESAAPAGGVQPSSPSSASVASSTTSCQSAASSACSIHLNNNVYKTDEDKRAPQSVAEPGSKPTTPRVCDNLLLQSLSEGCKENVLNVEFLLGKRHLEPFLLDLSDKQDPLSELRSRTRKRILRKLRKRKRLKQLGNNANPGIFSDHRLHHAQHPTSNDVEQQQPVLRLQSVKMQGLQGLLCSEKINTSAIQLQLTAQSQVGGANTNKKLEDASLAAPSEGRPKRARRE